MPSSTSNSSERAFQGAWLQTWLGALLLVALVIGGLECFWRSQGHRPSVVDDADLWANYRRQAEDADSDTVVLLGRSRIQLGFDTHTFREQYPELAVLQLAIEGTSPLYTLRDLAQAPQFRGTIICSVTAAVMRSSTMESQREYVEHYHRQRNLAKRADRLISAVIQEHMVSVNPMVSAKSILASLNAGSLPRPYYLRTFADRSRAADYTMLDLARHRSRRVSRIQEIYLPTPPSPSQWLDELEQVETWVRQIQDRGGRVIFVRFPTTDEYWLADESNYPRAQYWDRFAATTSAETLHFQDVPALRDFECPDTSHLDQRDRAAFTTALAHELFGPPGER